MRRARGAVLLVSLVALASCASSSPKAAPTTASPTTGAPVVATTGPTTTPPTTQAPTTTTSTTVAPPTTIPALSAAEIRTAKDAERAWKQSLADPAEQGLTARGLMTSIRWYGVAEAPAHALTRDLGRERIDNQHPLSIRIAADFDALFKVLGLRHPTLRVLPVSPPPPPALVITFTGSGSAKDITLHIDNHKTQRPGSVPLPWTYTDHNHAATATYAVVAAAQDGSGAPGATITCTIFEGGETVASNTASGPYAAVTCTGPQPET
jgi:hypothetical protein